MADVLYIVSGEATLIVGGTVVGAHTTGPGETRGTAITGGEKKMLVWNDIEVDEKIKIYDKGVQMGSAEGVYQMLVSYRTGDMWAPKVEQVEALKMEANYFVDCILNNKTPFNDGQAGLRIVRMLEAADESLKQKGKIIQL